MLTRLCLAAMAACLVIGCSSGGADSGDSAANLPTNNPAPKPELKSDFASVSSLITQKCVGCHGAEGNDGIDLRTHDSIMKGGLGGPIVVAGNADGSKLVHSLRGTNGVKQMPMSAVPLSDPEVAMIKAWITAGAKAE